MGSLNTGLGAMRLPKIKLDTTLAELYKRASPKSANVRLGWVSCGVTSGIDLSPGFPRNSKYIYQDQAFITTPQEDLRGDNVELQRSLAKKYLSLIAQRDAFISGNAPLILFNTGQTPEQDDHDRHEAETTLSVLDPTQQPELIFCPGPSKIPMEEHGIDRLEYKIVLDDLESYPLTHSLETHWFLNSKAALARSGLPTPKADIIEIEGYPPPAGSCCSICASSHRNSDLPFIPPDCTGPRGRWLTSQTSRILSAIHSRPVPFVVKTQQAFGGAGTWLVPDAEQKSRLLVDLSGKTSADPDSDSSKESNDHGNGILRKLLSQLTPANAHLAPATILLTDLVPDPVGDYGLTFVVTESGGKPIFLAAAEQMIAHHSPGAPAPTSENSNGDGSNQESSRNSGGSADHSAWVGSTIRYARQDELHQRFATLIEEIAAWVASQGYVGPVGADVLETKDGKCYVVDLNVRTSGSVSLPLLRGHFWGERGLGCASSFSMTVKEGGRNGFIERWKKEFEEGKMLILSWYEDVEGGGESVADVVMGAEDDARLAELMGRVREGTEEVTF